MEISSHGNYLAVFAKKLINAFLVSALIEHGHFGIRRKESFEIRQDHLAAICKPKRFRNASIGAIEYAEVSYGFACPNHGCDIALEVLDFGRLAGFELSRGFA